MRSMKSRMQVTAVGSDRQLKPNLFTIIVGGWNILDFKFKRATTRRTVCVDFPIGHYDIALHK